MRVLLCFGVVRVMMFAFYKVCSIINFYIKILLKMH